MPSAISAESLAKRYLIGHKGASTDTLRHRIEAAVRSPLKWIRSQRRDSNARQEEFWALRDVSFDIEPGEVVGIIGRNGAGKSTLLKVLSRITEPTSGRIQLDGRVASLLEVGTGFHPDLTGRENIYLNGAILGMSKTEIRKKFDEIVTFSEVEKFLDTPVKRYSSGMYVRLAFAVAAHLEPEILIVDEVLAVGDSAFQKKCLGKMKQVSQSAGRTVLFVSHNLSAVSKLCTRGIVLENGRVSFFGTARQAVDLFHRSISDLSGAEGTRSRDVPEGEIRFVEWEIANSRLGSKHSCYSREECCFRFKLVCRRHAHDVRLGFTVRAQDETVLLSAHSQDALKERINLPPGTHSIEWIIRVPLQAGEYSLEVGIAGEIAAKIVQHDDWKPQEMLEVIDIERSHIPGDWRPLINEQARLRIPGIQSALG